jgi:hypothetical protein
VGEELRSTFTSTVGGVMTEEAGAITGDLELLTHPTSEAGNAQLEVLVRYAGLASGTPSQARPWRSRRVRRIIAHRTRRR